MAFYFPSARTDHVSNNFTLRCRFDRRVSWCLLLGFTTFGALDMAKGPARSWGFAIGIIGAWALLRELKTIDFPDFPEWPDFSEWQIKGTQDALEEQSEQLQTYEAERISDAQRIEATRASRQLAVGNYGTVDGSLGAFTGTWFETEGKAGDSCHVVRATPHSSASWKMFTGTYCRDARAQGLLPPRA